ncbi:MAG: 30S ribosomal protein S6 [Verrucomicrobiota bacterium]
MSRNYQGLIVLKTKSLEGSIDDLVSAVAREIEDAGAKVEKIENHGRRQFAYLSKEMEGGHYVSFTVAGDAAVIGKVQDRLRHNGNVHLQHFQRL